MDKEYERGYTSAIMTINKGADVQKLFDDSFYALEQDSFDIGWQEACLKNGAIKEDGIFKFI